MHHKIAGNRLGRNSSLRKAMIRDVAKAALIQQRICTTKAKAKEARKLVDKLITLGKKGTLADRRRAFAILCDHRLVSDLFKNTAPRFKNRIGGYTRIIPLGTRRGDNAQLAYLELTEKTEVKISRPKSTATAKKESLRPEAGEEKTEEKKIDFSAVSKKQGEKVEVKQIEPTKIEEPKKVPEVKRPPISEEKRRAPFEPKIKEKQRFNIFRNFFRRKSPGE